jgi:hypothetical protein
MPSDNAYAALVDEQGFVRQVIVIPFLNDNDDDITDYCNSIGLTGRWIDTSFLGSRRGKFAGCGDRYDEDSNNFVSWVSPTEGDA